MRSSATSIGWGLLIVASACQAPGAIELDAGDVDGHLDAGAVRVDAGPPPPPTDQVDLLLMIDDSSETFQAQRAFAAQLPRLLSAITTGDRDGDGTPDFFAARSLHVAIVDSDMGLGDVPGIVTCGSAFGDDGLMQIRARTPLTGCASDYASTYAATPNVFAFEAGGPRTATQVASDVGCVTTLGTGGCGFEFELEAPLKALSLTPTATGDSPVSWTHPGYHPPTFYGGTFGHGDDPATNGAFLRADSVLVLVTVNDEDDCSTPNPHIFSLDDPSFDGVELNLRCHAFADQLYPVRRYADGFLGLRAHPGRLVYAPITGVPPALAGASPTSILADPDMQFRVNPSMPNQILPACVLAVGGGIALPGIRMTQLAQQLDAAGAHTTVQSVCSADFGSATDAILAQLADALPL